MCWRRQIKYEAHDILHGDAAIDVMLTDPPIPDAIDAVALMTTAPRENPNRKRVIAAAELPGPRRARMARRLFSKAMRRDPDCPSARSSFRSRPPR
jgi:hypothetical protein